MNHGSGVVILSNQTWEWHACVLLQTWIDFFSLPTTALMAPPTHGSGLAHSHGLDGRCAYSPFSVRESTTAIPSHRSRGLLPHQEISPADAEVASLTHMVADGDPREVLSTTPGDLLVIGPRGSGLLNRLHVGSVAEALLDNPSAPLLVAHDNHTVEHITIAVDGSGYSEQA